MTAAALRSPAGRGLQRGRGRAAAPPPSPLQPAPAVWPLLCAKPLTAASFRPHKASKVTHRKGHETASSTWQSFRLSGLWVSGQGFSPQHPPHVANPGSSRLPTPRPARRSGTDALKTLADGPPAGAVPWPLTCASVTPCSSAARRPRRGGRYGRVRRRRPESGRGDKSERVFKAWPEGAPGRGGALSPRQALETSPHPRDPSEV